VFNLETKKTNKENISHQNYVFTYKALATDYKQDKATLPIFEVFGTLATMALKIYQRRRRFKHTLYGRLSAGK